MYRFIGLIGLFVILALAYAISSNRRQISWRLVFTGLGLQFVLALLILGVPIADIHGPLRFAFDAMNDGVTAVLGYTEEGSRFIFGSLLNVEQSGFIFAFQVLPTIIFMASLMSVFYHLGFMQKVVQGIAWCMQKSLNISGAESLSVAANIFVGQTEAPLVIKPYIARMTRSELLAVMTGGMATVAGGVLAAYVGLLKGRLPDIAGHLITASVMSAPAALVLSKMILPETETPDTLGNIPQHVDESPSRNIVEAAARGAGEGLHLALNVAAMLLAFIALIALADGLLGIVGEWIGFHHWGQAFIPEALRSDDTTTHLSLKLIFGWVFAPMALLMGIPWNEAYLAGVLLGEKIVLNEFVAYLNLSRIADQLSDRTVIILSYALCGFANFSSIAIQIGGIGGLAPNRCSDLATLGFRAVIGGSLAAFMTAIIAGLLI